MKIARNDLHWKLHSPTPLTVDVHNAQKKLWPGLSYTVEGHAAGKKIDGSEEAVQLEYRISFGRLGWQWMPDLDSLVGWVWEVEASELRERSSRFAPEHACVAGGLPY